ncbi:hypothetical protein Patl1_13133 [Pistacia atlantica]|uniref:Uncharacterized protein n=1 Tax=Pistacia atlantica TaxID=434234 RepID=A0ACC1AUX7_9ROSI|nr:hypothetical protein Patl1_13133 [Pistacia atlantica]
MIPKSLQKKVAAPCGSCKGKGFYKCKLCKGNATIKWSPLYDPIFINPCLCPTCDGNRAGSHLRFLNLSCFCQAYTLTTSVIVGRGGSTALYWTQGCQVAVQCIPDPG